MTTTSSFSAKIISLLRSRNKGRSYPSSLESGVGQSRLDRLPPELLSVVFSHCQDEDSTQGQPTSVKFPLNLAAVCWYWRTIINATPDLWTKIPKCNLVSAGRQYVDLISLFVARSGALPLHIDVDSGFEALHTHPIMQILLSCTKRWGTVHLSTNLEALKVLAPHIGPLPELRSINLDIWNYSHSDWKISFFSTSPKLREVSIAGWPGISAGLEAPWSQILSYSVNGGIDDHAGSYLGHLEIMDRLQSLSIMGFSSAPTSASASYILPCIISLAVDDLQHLEGLFTPSIQHLVFVAKSDVGDRHLDSYSRIAEFIRRSSAENTLETLDNNTRYDSFGDVEAFLKPLQNLRVLRISLYHGFLPIENTILRVLDYIASSQQIGLPLLEELVLRDALPTVMIDGAAEKLNSIGLRVDGSQPNGSTPKRRLCKFELEFGNVMEGQKAQEILGRFWEDGALKEVGENDLKTIEDWRMRLMDFFPELLDQSVPATRLLNPFFLAQADRLFEEMSSARLQNMAFLLLVRLWSLYSTISSLTHF